MALKVKKSFFSSETVGSQMLIHFLYIILYPTLYLRSTKEILKAWLAGWRPAYPQRDPGKFGLNKSCSMERLALKWRTDGQVK